MLSSSHPLITVGITAYNAQNTIVEAVESALNQNWSNIEIIIADDFSSDGTREIVQKLYKDNPSIKKIVLNEENKGVAYTRNQIIKHSQGEFIAFFDDDDVSEPGRITKQYERIISYKEGFAKDAPVLCYTARTQKYPDGSLHVEQTAGVDAGVAPNGVDVAYKILMGYPVKQSFGSMATCSQMVSVELCQKLNGFDEAFKRSEDTDFNVRAALEGAHFVGISEALVTQTMTKGGDKPLSLELECMLMMLDKHAKTVEQRASLEFCKKWICLKYGFLGGKKASFIVGLFLLALRYPVSAFKRILWSLPNINFHLKSRYFYKSES